MVGTLLKMIASPTINQKPLEETSEDTNSQLRNSPIKATDEATEDYNQVIASDNPEDDRTMKKCQNNDSENKDTTAACEPVIQDDDIDGDVTDSNSITFHCSCRVWSCTQCNKAFTSARALKIHEVKQHENMPKRYIKCSHCDEVFDHGNLLQIHMKVHHNIKVQCPQCKDQYKPINTKTHNPEALCPVCGVKFDHDKLLKLHMEHYHKVSKKDTSHAPTEQTFQQVATLLSPSSNQLSPSPETRAMSPDLRKRSPSPRLPDGGLSRSYYDNNSEDSSSRNSVSPREIHSDNREPDRKELFHGEQFYNSSMYQQRLRPSTVPHSAYYLPFHESSPPPYAAMNFYPPGVRRHIEKRPLGRSHSLPLKQEVGYPEVPTPPWQIPEAGNPMLYGFPRDKKIDRAALEAVRNSLKAKLRTVEATLLREETDAHQQLSPTLQELHEHQRYFYGREDDLVRPYRPSVITPRGPFGGFTFKRKAQPSDLEPIDKMRTLEKGDEIGHDSIESPSRSPGHPMSSFGPRPREGVAPGIYDPRGIPKVVRDDLSIPNIQREYSFEDQAKIFIKRGAPKCNRCQQTFSSKMEYLHHLISHREKDGLVDASPEEIEFIEDVKRSINVKNFPVGEVLEFRNNSTNSSGSHSPQGKSALGCTERNVEPKAENAPEDQSPSPSAPNPNALSLGTETCSECKDVFADTASYRVHIEKRHMKPRCRECGLTFDHKNLLKIHMDCYHSSIEVLQCYYCGMSFKQRSAFLDHVTSHEAQDINTKNRTIDQGGESSETGGRRRWARLVASAQLPVEKFDPLEKEHGGLFLDESLGLRGSLSLKSHVKTKLRKTVSLSAYTDMINRQKRNAAECLRESRSKGDEAIGKEMRTRIFLPSFEDKMENLTRFAASSAQLAKKRVSPPPKASQVQDDGDYFIRRRNLENQDVERLRAEERPPFADDSKSYPFGRYGGEKRKLVRLKRSAPVDDSDEDVRAAHLAFPLRKAFVRDEVESLYQLRHKKAFHGAEVNNSQSKDPLDHRNALVKIERVEVDPSSRKVGPSESEKGNVAKRRRPSPLAQQEPSVSDSDVALATNSVNNDALNKHVEATDSTAVPPPLIDTRRCTQVSTLSSAVSTDSSPTSSRPDSPVVTAKTYETKVKSETHPSSPPTGEMNEKGKRRSNIKKLTKEALINSLSLKRRASAPDLFQFNRDSTESTTSQKAKYNANVRPGSPSVGSDGTSSPSMDTKHHGSRSLYYTPRRQSDRDITCAQCGVSFGHKKLYKIHLDSYHGKQQGHECLQCGTKDFRNKDEFVRHLMAHQSKGKVNDDVTTKDSTANQEVGTLQDMSCEVSYDNGRELNPKTKKVNRNSGEGGDRMMNSDEEKARFSPQASSSDHPKALVNDDSSQESQLNNNTKGSIDKRTTCFTCGKTFENGKQLEQHFSSHASISEDGRFCCVLCGKAFETHRKLEVHSRSHTGFKPHKCEQCGRCFPYYSSYYYHKMTHTKDRPHKCPICGKGFIQTRYLRSHLGTHKDDQGSVSDEVESIIRKAELNMNDETDEESIDSPGTGDNSPGYRANDEEAATAEILCSFKRGLNCSTQNSDSESTALPNPITSEL